MKSYELKKILASSHDEDEVVLSFLNEDGEVSSFSIDGADLVSWEGVVSLEVGKLISGDSK